jgi:hypothetical protein
MKELSIQIFTNRLLARSWFGRAGSIFSLVLQAENLTRRVGSRIMDPWTTPSSFGHKFTDRYA